MVYITQLIFIKAGKRTDFELFENEVIPLMADHRGTLLYRVQSDGESTERGGGKVPDEIHVVAFESEADFQGYLKDSRRTQLVPLKEASVEKTITLKGKLL